MSDDNAQETSLARDLRDQYEITMEKIAKVGENYSVLAANTPAGYREVTLAIADCRTHRGTVERRRKELKKGALEYGREVDRVARELRAAVEDIEEPLKEKKAAVDAVKQAERDRLAEEKRIAAEAELAAAREEEEARLRAIREKEEARLAVEREAQRIEAERLAAERAELEAAQLAERDRLAEERRVLEAERQELDRVRLAEQAAKDAEETAKREAALAPDLERLTAWATQIEDVAAVAPAMANTTASQLVGAAHGILQGVIAQLRSAGGGA